MPSFKDTRILDYSIDQLFKLVSNVGEYPEFIPWCTAAKVWDETPEAFRAELTISFMGLAERYTSIVRLTPPDNGHAEIDAELEQGPFKKLVNHWVFTSINEKVTRIEFFVDFEFKSRLLDKLIGGMFEKATHKMVSAFETRAKQLYG